MTLRAWCGLLWLLAIQAVHVFAADSAPAGQGTPSPESANARPAPEALTEWTRDALSRIAAARMTLATGDTYDEELAAYAALATRFDARLSRFVTNPGELGELSDVALEDVGHELSSIARSATDIDDAVAQRMGAIEGQLRDLTATAVHARELRDGTSYATLPPSLQARVRRIVSESQPLLQTERMQLDRVADLQNKLLALDERVDALRQSITVVGAKRLRGLLHFGQPPLWAVTRSELEFSTVQSGELAVMGISASLRDFAGSETARIVLHVLLLCGIVWLMLALRVTQRRNSKSRVVSKSVGRPLSAGVLVTLLATPLLYVDVPLAVRSVVGIVLLTVSLRMLTLYTDRLLWKPLFALVGVAILIRVVTAVPLAALIDRLAMLVIGVTSIAVLVWAMRLHVERGLDLSPPRQRHVQVLLGGSVLVSAVAVIFNVLGNASLAGLLQVASTFTLVLAAGMYAAVKVMNEIAQLIAEGLERRGVRSVIRYRDRFVAELARFNAVLGFIIWSYYTVTLYRLDSSVGALIADALSLQWKIGNVTLSLGRLLAFVVAVWIGFRASRLTQILLNDDVLPQFALPRGVPNAISMLANYVIVVIGILVGAGILGIGLSNLLLIVGALGVGIGFGLQNIVNNFVSGLILLFERPVQVGDAVQLGSVSGRVTRIGFRASCIRTYGGSEVVVPNADLISNQLVNWTLSDLRRRLEPTVGVAYGSDTEHVTETLLGVLKADPEVLVDPAPFVVFEGFGDSALSFRCYAWIADFANSLTVTHRLNSGINKALTAAGIEIPFPQRDVHLKELPQQWPAGQSLGELPLRVSQRALT